MTQDNFDPIFQSCVDPRIEHQLTVNKVDRLSDLMKSKDFFKTINSSVQISYGELLLIMLKHSLKIHSGMSEIEKLFRSINCIFRRPILPETSYTIDKTFNPLTNVTYHKFCPYCKGYLGILDNITFPVTCSHNNCGLEISSHNARHTDIFLLIDPSEAIENHLEANQDYYKFVVSGRRHRKNYFTDIYDGLRYRSQVKLLRPDERNRYATLILNADGAQPFENSNDSVWPIYLQINELPMNKRFKNLITCGIWYSKNVPNMTLFMDKFVEMMNNISDAGISCNITGEMWIIKPFILLISVDTPARVKMNGSISFSGYYGCDFCEILGHHDGDAMRYPVQANLKLRDHESTLQHMQSAEEKKLPVVGFKLVAPLINLKKIDIIKSFCPEYLHCVLSGVGKQISRLIVKKFLKNPARKDIDNYLKLLKPPSKVQNLTRPWTENGKWKAKDWENWILYYSLPVFEMVNISLEIIKYWSLFVESIYILTSSQIHIDDINSADSKLQQFVIETEKTFHIGTMTYNIHQMLHLTEYVMNYGPLFLYSAFPFESENGRLLRAVNCAQGVPNQIVRYLNLNRAVRILKETVYPNAYEHVKDFYDKYDNNKRFQEIVEVDQDTFFNDEFHLNDEIQRNFNLSNSAKAYRQMLKNGCPYTSAHKVNARSCNSYAVLEDNTFIRIILFVNDPETRQQICIYSSIDVMEYEHFSTLKMCTSFKKSLKSVNVKNISKICVMMELDDVKFICPMANMQTY